MLKKLHYTVPKDLLQEAEALIPQAENRYVINEPTGRFFYDPWKLTPEYQNTVWEKIMSTLPVPVGEARIMVLKPGTAYSSHADTDDRYHLNINGEACYLIDLDNNQMHKLEPDGIWYEMDAGRLHTASKFGRYYRVQLVIRKLLNDVILKDPVSIELSSTGYSKEDARFLFDNTLNNWLNLANKKQVISDFKFSSNKVSFKLERSKVQELQDRLVSGFQMEIV